MSCREFKPKTQCVHPNQRHNVYTQTKETGFDRGVPAESLRFNPSLTYLSTQFQMKHAAVLDTDVKSVPFRLLCTSCKRNMYETAFSPGYRTCEFCLFRKRAKTQFDRVLTCRIHSKVVHNRLPQLKACSSCKCLKSVDIFYGKKTCAPCLARRRRH